MDKRPLAAKSAMEAALMLTLAPQSRALVAKSGCLVVQAIKVSQVVELGSLVRDNTLKMGVIHGYNLCLLLICRSCRYWRCNLHCIWPEQYRDKWLHSAIKRPRRRCYGWPTRWLERRHQPSDRYKRPSSLWLNQDQHGPLERGSGREHQHLCRSEWWSVGRRPQPVWRVDV